MQYFTGSLRNMVYILLITTRGKLRDKYSTVQYYNFVSGSVRYTAAQYGTVQYSMYGQHSQHSMDRPGVVAYPSRGTVQYTGTYATKVRID